MLGKYEETPDVTTCTPAHSAADSKKAGQKLKKKKISLFFPDYESEVTVEKFNSLNNILTFQRILKLFFYK